MSVKSEKSPSVLGFYFYASLMALFGASLGFVYMVNFPAQAFSSQKEYEASLAELEAPIPAPKPGDAYFVEGPVVRTRTWEPKRAQLVAAGPQTVKFSAGEINAWMTAKFRPGSSPAGEVSSVLIVPGVPNVAITEAGTLYLNLPTTITAYGSSSDFTVSARCVVDASGLQFKTIQVSSAKVPFPNSLGKKIFEILSQSYQSSEEYTILSDAFARANSIELIGGELVFKLR